MKKFIRMTVAALVCLVVFAASNYAQEPVYIGLSSPMTGQYEGYGDKLKKGIDLALDEINKEGGIDGRPLALIVRDSQGLPKISKRIARKFTADTRIVAAIGDFTSTCSMAAQSLYRGAGMVQLSPTASHPSFAPGSPFSFGIAGTQAGNGPIMARKAVLSLQKKKLAVLYINNDWGVAAQKFFIEEAERLGAKIVGTESYLDGTTDFIAALEKFRTLQPEVLHLCSMYKDAAMVSKQRQELGWDDVIFMGAGPLYSPQFIELAGEAAENMYISTTFFPQNPRPEIQTFMQAYETRYNSIPNVFDACGYDTLNLLAEAMRKAGTDRKAIRDELAKTTDFPGVDGIITFTQHGDVVKEYVLLHVKNGKFVLVPEE